MAGAKDGWAGSGGAGVVGGALDEDVAVRLRAENAALRRRIADLEAKVAKVEAMGAEPDEAESLRSKNTELQPRLAELEANLAETRALRAELDEAIRRNEEKRQDRRVLDREIVELRGMLAEAERQLGNIRQTFVYRIGDTIVSARTWKGFRQLPRRLIALRRAWREKRGPSGRDGLQQKRPAERLRFVEETLKVLAEQGLEVAAAQVRAVPERHGGDKARALVELALGVRLEHPAEARTLGVEAASLDPDEPRLRALVLGLFDQGEVQAPAALLACMGEGLMARPADQVRRETILDQARQLSSPLVFPSPSPPFSPASFSQGPMRLAVVSPRSLPQHAEAITFRAQAVIDAARESGHEALLVTAPGYQYPKSGDGGPAARTVGATQIIRLAAGEAPGEAFQSFVSETGAALAALFLRHRITHVHALAGTPLAAAALWAARRAGARFILDIGGVPAFGGHAQPDWAASERFRAGYRLFADVARGADQVIVRSAAVAQSLEVDGLLERPLVVEDALPAGFTRASAASVRDIRRELGLADQRLIGVFESIDEDEGLADLVRALPAIREAEPSAAIFFCGSGKGGQSLRQLAARLDVADHVLIPSGFVRQRTPDYLSAFSVAVFPKHRSLVPGLSAPFELQAALSVGAPVVATDNTWARDWISDSATGLSVEVGDVDGLASAILRLMGDADLGERLGGAGRALLDARGRRSVIDPTILALLAGSSGRAAA